MADGAILKKTVKSPYLCDRSIDFDEIWQDDKHWPRTADLPLKFRIFENPRLNDIYKIWCAYAKWAFYPTIKKIVFHKSKMADGRHFENC